MDGTGRTLLTKDAFKSINWSFDIQMESAFSGPVIKSFQPGAILKAKPNLVQDLSGTGKGLDVLLGR
jgi:hypothetical protein